MQRSEYGRLSQSEDSPTNGPANGTASEDKKIPLRPYTYYDEGPFEAPSSESEEETLLEKDDSLPDRNNSPGVAEGGFAFRQNKVSSAVTSVV